MYQPISGGKKYRWKPKITDLPKNTWVDVNEYGHATYHHRPSGTLVMMFSSTGSRPSWPWGPSLKSLPFGAFPEPMLLPCSVPRYIHPSHLCVPIVCCTHSCPAVHAQPSWATHMAVLLNCNLTVQASAIYLVWTPERWQLQCLMNQLRSRQKESSSRW